MTKKDKRKLHMWLDEYDFKTALAGGIHPYRDGDRYG